MYDRHKAGLGLITVQCNLLLYMGGTEQILAYFFTVSVMFSLNVCFATRGVFFQDLSNRP